MRSMISLTWGFAIEISVSIKRRPRSQYRLHKSCLSIKLQLVYTKFHNYIVLDSGIEFNKNDDGGRRRFIILLKHNYAKLSVRGIVLERDLYSFFPLHRSSRSISPQKLTSLAGTFECFWSESTRYHHRTEKKILLPIAYDKYK